MTTPMFVLLAAFTIFVLMDMPIAFALGVSSLVYLVMFDAAPVIQAAQKMVSGLDSFALLSIPLFVFAAGLMTKSGITQRIVRLCNAIVGNISGGLAIVAVLACLFFGALSGSGVADVVAVGSIMLPAMRAKGYSAGFSCALIGCAGSIASIVPPSITLIIYGTTTGTSIGQLFLAGIVPSILCSVSLMVIAWLISKKNNWGGTLPFSWTELFAALRGALIPMIAPVIITGGIKMGFFTPTEAGGVAILYTVIVGTLIYRQLGFSSMVTELKAAAEISSVILITIAAAALFGWILAAEQVPVMFANAIQGITDQPWLVLLMLQMLLLVLGTFMETIAVIIILAPVLMPLLARYGIDPVHFGILMTVNMAIGANTPPLAVTLQAACRIANIPVAETIKPVLMFLGAMTVVMFLMTYFPSLVMFLPKHFG
jgi:tripartite ATP-independent transporter DctM subunit